MRNAGDPNDGVTRKGKDAADVCSNSFKGSKPPCDGRMSLPPLHLRCHIEGVVH
jgi:hypothetical protein